MDRIPRTAAALAVAAVLLSAAVPAAQARTLVKPQAPSITGSWFDAALVWASALFPGATHAQAAASGSFKKGPPIPLPIPFPLPGGGAQPMGCSTIDPNGSTAGGTGGGPGACGGGGGI